MTTITTPSRPFGDKATGRGHSTATLEADYTCPDSTQLNCWCYGSHSAGDVVGSPQPADLRRKPVDKNSLVAGSACRNKKMNCPLVADWSARRNDVTMGVATHPVTSDRRGREGSPGRKISPSAAAAAAAAGVECAPAAAADAVHVSVRAT